MEPNNPEKTHVENKIEENYPENQHNPGPSKEAVEEKDDKKASYTMNWVILIVCIVLGLIYLLFLQ